MSELGLTSMMVAPLSHCSGDILYVNDFQLPADDESV